MGTTASQITSLRSVYSAVYSGTDQRKHQSSASLAFVRGIRRGPVNSPHKGPGTWKILPFDDVIMIEYLLFIFLCILWLYYCSSPQQKLKMQGKWYYFNITLTSIDTQLTSGFALFNSVSFSFAFFAALHLSTVKLDDLCGRQWFIHTIRVALFYFIRNKALLWLSYKPFGYAKKIEYSTQGEYPNIPKQLINFMSYTSRPWGRRHWKIMQYFLFHMKKRFLVEINLGDL